MMHPPYITEEALTAFINTALAEDIGSGDHSTLGAVSEAMTTTAQLLVKENGIIAGLELAERIFRQFDPGLTMNALKQDGDEIVQGDIAFLVKGPARSILSTERVVLNCMQRMSGIATYTRSLCQLIAGTSAQLMDTRKTTPNFRLAEKWAVTIGGGVNHRLALDKMVMLKDNHVDLAGGIPMALENARRYLTKKSLRLPIEVETRSLQEVRDVLASGGASVIMLDNMSQDDMKTAVRLIAGRYKTEASGGITESNLREIAECGVDFISVGALTHSVKSLDLSLKVIKTQ